MLESIGGAWILPLLRFLTTCSGPLGQTDTRSMPRLSRPTLCAQHRSSCSGKTLVPRRSPIDCALGNGPLSWNCSLMMLLWAARAKKTALASPIAQTSRTFQRRSVWDSGTFAPRTVLCEGWSGPQDAAWRWCDASVGHWELSEGLKKAEIWVILNLFTSYAWMYQCLMLADAMQTIVISGTETSIAQFSSCLIVQDHQLCRTI